MTPAARVSAAINILDQILDGRASEPVLTTWARANRYAGSGDRAAIRDLVFDAIRRKRSVAAEGGAETGRGLMIGLLRQQGADLAALFDGSRYGPPALGPDEGQARRATRAEALDVQDWCLPLLEQALGTRTDDICRILRDRAPVFLRMHSGKTTPSDLIALLATQGIVAAPHELSPTALQVTEGARRLRQTTAFEDGLFELQDAASQAVVDTLGDRLDQAQVLDYCAGGGGKALAMAAFGASVTAHDANAPRMKDIPDRARRAGADIAIAPVLSPDQTFETVLVDAPCSGSGAWRRQPDAKWALSPDDLKALTALQSEILASARHHVRPGGCLAYATCSMFEAENHAQVQAFLDANPGWRCTHEQAFTPLQGGDGFFVAHLFAPANL